MNTLATHTMSSIIDTINKSLIKGELTDDKFLKHTSRGGNRIYVVTNDNAPNTLREIGRLREITFRLSGSGSGLPCDLDEFDLMENGYKQLIVWNPDTEEIIGGYRFMFGKDVSFKNNRASLMTEHLFHFSERFTDNYLPRAIELGRAFIQPDYQSSKMGSKSIFALDNLWDGLGAVLAANPSYQYFFGKITLPTTLTVEAQELIIRFFELNFPDHEHLLACKTPYRFTFSKKYLDDKCTGNDLKERYKSLNSAVRSLGFHIPPLISAYFNLSPSIISFGSSVNTLFMNAVECGIMIPVYDIYEEKKKRYLIPFSSLNSI